MKKLIITSVCALTIGAANATTYIGNADTSTADWDNWIATMPAETAAAVNNLATAINDNAQTMDKMNEVMAGWNYHLFGENGDMTDGLFWSYYLRDGGVQKRLAALENGGGSAAAFGRLSDKISHVNKELSAGIANVAALSSVAVSDVSRGEVSFGGGYGYHNSQSAVAFGAAMGLTDNWSMNAGLGFNDYDVTVRAGTNVKFKLF
ncbi:hypothetical protein HDR66_02580 [bacterium]|nr:hypothetical protein [bacterium]